jgi:hypothetical protein
MDHKKTILQFICCLTFAFAFGQSDTINQLDANGKKHGLWLTYYPNSTTVKLEGQYANGVPSGNYKRYYENGKVKETGSFKDNHYCGALHCFYENGQLKRTSHFNDTGEESDTSWYFHADGKIFSKEIFHPNRQLQTSIVYKQNGSVPDTMITVISDSNFRYTLLNDFKLSNAPKARQFNYQLTFETTPIYREYLLTLYADSTYSVARYVYEGCYNYIDKSYGSWKKLDNTIQLNTTTGFTFNHQLNDSDPQLLTTEEILESDGKLRRYLFQQVQR